MDKLQWQALQIWSECSNEGVLVVDRAGTIRLINSRLRELFKLERIPDTSMTLLSQTADSIPELRVLMDLNMGFDQVRWGSLRVQKYPIRRLNWQQVPLFEQETVVGFVTIFRDAIAQGQLEVSKQSFLSMISHDLRTPLSTILGFAELLYNNREHLADDEQREFLEHIIKNANDLSRYTQIALDIMYLEANMQNFDVQPVLLDRFVTHWMADALHRFPTDRLVYRNGAPDDPMTQIAPAALHKILYILVEFALAESPSDHPVSICLNYDADQAHVVIQHRAPALSAGEAAMLFQLMNPRDLSELGRPHLHRMQLYVASLLAERQQGSLILRGSGDQEYQIDLALPLMSVMPA